MTWLAVIAPVVVAVLLVAFGIHRVTLSVIRRVVVDPQIGDAEARRVIGRIVGVRR